MFLPPKTLVFEGAMDWRIAAECHHEHPNTLLEALKLHIQFENHAELRSSMNVLTIILTQYDVSGEDLENRSARRSLNQ